MHYHDGFSRQPITLSRPLLPCAPLFPAENLKLAKIFFIFNYAIKKKYAVMCECSDLTCTHRATPGLQVYNTPRITGMGL